MEKGYILRVISHASFKKMFDVIKVVKTKSNKSSIAIFFDILLCTKKYGAGYYDYLIFQFYNLNAEQRSTYVTRFISKKMNLFLNDDAYAHLFDNKDEFYEVFEKYTGRSFLRLNEASKEEVQAFVSNKSVLFCKMRDKECGIGCEKVNVADYETFDQLYDYLMQKEFYTVEDYIVQHPALNTLYPHCVNSLRIITLLGDDKKAHCIYVVQKVGINGSVVDNNCLFSPVDMETGEILYPAHSGETTKGIIYTEHPNTHVKLVGYKIPFVKEAIDMCLEAAYVVPQIRYIGWDVAITPNGPVIIEGNTYCAHDFWQLPPHTPDKIGMLPTIKKIVPSFKY